MCYNIIDMIEFGGIMMTEHHNGTFTGERAMYQAKDMFFRDCIFEDGESPLKHSENITLVSTSFRWKYPLWYSKHIDVSNTDFEPMARAGIWYTDNISLKDCRYDAPKGFRRCSGVDIKNVVFSDAAETLWQCSAVKLEKVSAKGDYFAMNCSDMIIDGLELDGNYSFDGAKNVHVTNSKLMSKDAFWNSENITVENTYISGEYIGWNSKKLTFINCIIESLQGFCYIEDLVLKNCKLAGTSLAFEYSSVDAELSGPIDSIKNPLSGRIVCDEIGELILDPSQVDVTATKILSK